MGKFLFNPITGQLDQSGGSSLTLGTTATTAAAGIHASTHHTGGTDAIAPNQISAAWAQVLSTQNISGDTVLSAGRNRRIGLGSVSAVTANITLPFSNNQAGDTITLVGVGIGPPFASTYTIRLAGAFDSDGNPVGYTTLATINALNQSFTFVSDGTRSGWGLRAVDTHSSTHHTGGADAIAPNQISAAWAQTTTSTTLTDGSTTEISAARNLRYEFVYSGSSVTTIRLPSSGNISGDEILIVWVAGGSTGNLPVQRFSGAAWSTIATITARPASFRFRFFSTTWSLVSVDTHTHAAADVTSGVFDNARINFAAPSAIGSTTPAAITGTTGTFSTLSANNGTITASAPVLDLSQTWNNAAVTFTGMRFNVTNTASATASQIIDLQVGGTSAFRIRRDGATVIPFSTNGPTTVGCGFGSGINATHGLWCESGRVGLTAGNDYQFTVTTTGATVLSELRVGDQGCILRGENSAANASGVILAQRNGTNPQEYRLYNTYSSSGANHERGFMRWSSNVLQIGTEKGGTGSARALEFQTDGTTRAQITLGGTSWFYNQFAFGNLSSQPMVRISGNGDGVFQITNNAVTGFDRLQFGGQTSSFPALKRSSTTLQVRLADDSADAPFSSGAITTSGTVTANNTTIGFVTSSAPNGASPIRFAANSGDVLIQSANAAGIVEFRGTTGTNPQSLRVFNTFTSGTSFERLNIRWASNECIIDAEAGSGGGTLRGIKIGSATSSLLGFYGATPVTQRAAIADATDAATTQARLNDLLAAMRSLGLIAT